MSEHTPHAEVPPQDLMCPRPGQETDKGPTPEYLDAAKAAVARLYGA